MISPAVCETAVQLLQALADDAPLPQAEEGLIREQG
jgi:serine protease inhibitor ecotin